MRKNDLKLDHVIVPIKRIPLAFVNSTIQSAKAALPIFSFLFPVFVIVKMPSRKPNLFKEAALSASDWAIASGIFTFSETFIEKVRGVEDRWNAYIGSGTASGTLSMLNLVKDRNQIPITRRLLATKFGEGFLSGFGFVYFIDKAANYLNDLKSPDASINSVKASKKIDKPNVKNTQVKPKLKTRV
jgi:hypothetical protein